ncbi:MAG TPA: methyltransferase domain-containing protein [Blastocatellia bacterium]|nr:methyltransferase domain-containing protein [Blastocatellia bacterium]
MPDDRTAKQWDPAGYDGKSSFVWKLATDVIELLSPEPGERILDLGCGTGHLTQAIAARGAKVVGLDVSPAMIDSARRNYPDLRFELGDGTDFHFDEPFDAVFSNAAIHWMRGPARVVDCISRALKRRGRFVAEFGGRGNLARLHGAIRDSVTRAGYQVSEEASFRFYPSVGEYAALLEGRGFEVTFACLFDRPTPLEGGENGLRNWMGVFADSYVASVPAGAREGVIRDVEAALRPELYRDGAWRADYRRIRVAAVKE